MKTCRFWPSWPARFAFVAGTLLLAATAQAQLAITEMMSSALKTNGMIISTNNSDFWELTNFGSNTVNTARYQFSDDKEKKHPLANIFMKPGESVIFVHNGPTTTADQFRAWWGSCVSTNVRVFLYDKPGFSSNGDGIRVYDSAGDLVDSVDFGPAKRGVSFVYDTITGAFGPLSVLDQGGTCRASNAADIASPGTTTGPIQLRILQQPTNVTACLGGSNTFTVSAVGMPPPHYQWFHNDESIRFANGASLTVPNVIAANAGRYWVVITNGLTILQSSNAILTLDTNPAAPSFVVRPANTTAVTNSTARFSVSVCANPEATYQWFSNGVALVGATGRTLLVPNCTLAMNNAQFCVRVQNSSDTNTACARLYVTIKPDLRITEVQAYPVTGCDEHHDWFEVTNFGTNTVDMLGYRFSDTQSLEGSVTVTQSMVIQPHESVVFAKNPKAKTFINWWGADRLPPGLKVFPYGGFSLSKLGDHLYLWNAQAEEPGEAIESISYASNFVGVSQYFDADTCPFGCDSVLGEFGAFSAVQCGDIGSPGYTAVPSNQPPIILTQPSGLAAYVGGRASFSSFVFGAPSLTYQWRRNGTNLVNDSRISGATSSILTLSNVIASDAAIYSVRVTNLFGSALSSNASLFVSLVDHFSWSFIPSPQSSFLPFAARVEARDSSNRLVTSFTGTVDLSASNAANGTALPVLPVVSGTFVAGVWSGSLSVPQFAASAVLRAVDGLGNSGVSAPFSVEQATVFTLQPAGQNVLPGTNVTLVASAVGIGPVRYQWRLEGTNIPGATNASYNFTNASLANHGNYSVLATDGISSAISSNAFVFVLIRPGFVQQPQPVTVLQGQTATFSVVVTGAPPIYYRWIRGGTSYLTSSVPVLVLTNVQASASIQVAATNMASGPGGLNSSTVQLTVLPDNDGDGMADAWEVQYGFNTNNAADAVLDFDGDGMSNRDEYIAGTDPTDPLSLLQLVLTATNSAILQFVAQTNISYTVQYRTSLISEDWSNLANITAETLIRTVKISVPVSPPESARFYRIVTPLVP